MLCSNTHAHSTQIYVFYIVFRFLSPLCLFIIYRILCMPYRNEAPERACGMYENAEAEVFVCVCRCIVLLAFNSLSFVYSVSSRKRQAFYDSTSPKHATATSTPSFCVWYLYTRCTHDHRWTASGWNSFFFRVVFCFSKDCSATTNTNVKCLLALLSTALSRTHSQIFTSLKNHNVFATYAETRAVYVHSYV